MKAIFKASDGSEHDSKAAAGRQDRIINASRALEEAAQAFERAVGESCLTADGEPFDMRRFRSYWRVQRRYLEMPVVVEISVYPHGLSIDGNSERMVVRWYEHRDGRGGDYQTHPISELYASKEKADAARLALMETDLAEFTEEVRKAREKIKP